jgi:predicted N-acetyltransferase YhbS
MKMMIREERPEDYNSILSLTYKAFLTLDYPGRQRMDEHFLVSLLQGSEFVIPELCFVADFNGEIAGHILYAKSEVLAADGTKIQTITFGPLSVLPKYHRQGIGSALVRHSLEKARELGYGAVLILDVPDYYPKLGFRRAKEYGLMLPDGTAPDAFMAYELIPGSLNNGGEFHLSAPEFELAETDNAGYEKFHKEFMSKNYQGKLMLRPLLDADISFLEKWLLMPHIVEWFKSPDDWICEIRNRYGEFSFITHFIAEVDGVAMGFCQYYDCYFGQQQEDWYTVNNPGIMFSIDYLIGEPEYLHKGYGREMVRLLGEMLTKIGAKRVVVQPDKENASSCNVLEANGYIYNGEYYMKDLSPQTTWIAG